METPAMTKRSVARDERRTAIIDIAMHEFLQEGFAATSMSSIAARLGGSKATLYNYFTSKEELFAASVTTRCEQLLSIIYELESEGGDFRASLQRLGERFLGLILSDDAVLIFRLVVAEAGRFPELGSAFYSSGPHLGTERIAEFFSHAVEAGHLKQDDPLAMSHAFVALCSSDIHKKRLCNVEPCPSADETAKLVERGVTQFLAIYGK
jgi:AcrR family transcriptional regulator